jgi:hypothetical protein
MILNGDDFIRVKVCVLDPRFDLVNNGGTGDYSTEPGPYTPPACDPGTQAGDVAKATIAAAFKAAPKKTQDKLCALKNLFVDNSGAAAYAFWEAPGQDPSNPAPGWYEGAYIVVPGTIGTSYTSSLTQEETHTALLRDEINALGPNGQAFLASGPLAYVSADRNGPEMAALAILGHELGHIVWYDRFVPNLRCKGGGSFVGGVWKRPLARAPAFHNFGVGTGNKYDDPSPSTFVERVNADILQGPGLFPAAAKDLRTLYGFETGPVRFPSFFGSQDPDEDFAETYKLMILTMAQQPLTHLSIQLPGMASPKDVIQNLGRPKLKQRIDCINDNDLL